MHRAPSHSVRDAELAALRVMRDGRASDDAALMAEVLAAPTNAAWDSRRLAIGLGLSGDARQAAELVGLRVDDVRLRALETEARATHGDFIAGNSRALSHVAHSAIVLAAVRLAATVDAIKPSYLAKTMATVAQSLHAILGDARPVFETINVIVEAPPEKRAERPTLVAT